jgi:hypothetical protein
LCECWGEGWLPICLVRLVSGEAYTAFIAEPPLFFACTTGPSRCKGGKQLTELCLPGTHARTHARMARGPRGIAGLCDTEA